MIERRAKPVAFEQIRGDQRLECIAYSDACGNNDRCAVEEVDQKSPYEDAGPETVSKKQPGGKRNA